MTYIEHEPLKCWAEEDRPREKMLRSGARSLSEAELLAILIGTGNHKETAVELSRRILASCGNDLRSFSRMDPHELMQYKGIGEAKAITIVAALEIARRREIQSPAKKDRISSSKDVYRLLGPKLGDLSHEEFWIIILNRANRILATELISKGGISGTVVDPKVVFGTALIRKGSAVILIHNHPSGNLKASDADISITRKLKSAGQELDLPVLDHLIVTDTGYLSFADEGIL